jgi:hypothetical protein
MLKNSKKRLKPNVGISQINKGKNMQKEIFEYIKENDEYGQNRIVGVILAKVVDGEIRIGWSRTNFNKGDVFDKEEGLRLARGRAEGSIGTPRITRNMFPVVREMQIRALRYFKNGMFFSEKRNFENRLYDNEPIDYDALLRRTFLAIERTSPGIFRD